MNKLDPKISFKCCFLDLDEIPETIDIKVKLPESKPAKASKTTPRAKKGDGLALF